MIRLPETKPEEYAEMKRMFLDAGLADILGLLEFQDYSAGRHAEFADGYVSRFACPQLVTRLTVLEDGIVVPCCVDLTGALRLGDANKQTIEEIWTSQVLRKLRETHAAGCFYRIPTCRNCDWAVKEDAKSRDLKYERC